MDVGIFIVRATERVFDVSLLIFVSIPRYLTAIVFSYMERKWRIFFSFFFLIDFTRATRRERKRKRDWKKFVCKRTSWERMQTVCHKAIEWLGFSMHPILPSTSMHGGLNAILSNVKCITLWRDAVLTGFSFSPRQHGVQYNFWSLDRNGQIFV